MPFFSVVIPLYNKEDHISDTLKGVLAQTFDDFEVIIVNDGSTDGSREILDQFKDERIKIFDKANEGVAIARNEGIEKAVSKYIALTDADDLWSENHLEELHRSICLHPNEHVFSNAYSLKIGTEKTVEASYAIKKATDVQLIGDYFNASVIHPMIMTSSVAFTKEGFIDVERFNPKIYSGQDIDLWIRFMLKNKLVFNWAMTSCYVKTVANSLSKQNHQLQKAKLFNNYRKEEEENTSLHRYLNLNRYSLAIQAKLVDNDEVYESLIPSIDTDMLNTKQRIILSSPNSLVRLYKKMQQRLVNSGIYISSFK